ncbi:MAG: hypothetical protein HC908_04180 [Calothrix sp. SM1_7_51]|nr:hypothetical protein [Calothrix sp. SM1_7_51]
MIFCNYGINAGTSKSLGYVDLRRRLEPQVNRENLGALAFGFTSLHNVDINTHFLDLARDVKHQLEVGLKSEDIFTKGPPKIKLTILWDGRPRRPRYQGRRGRLPHKKIWRFFYL